MTGGRRAAPAPWLSVGLWPALAVLGGLAALGVVAFADSFPSITNAGPWVIAAAVVAIALFEPWIAVVSGLAVPWVIVPYFPDVPMARTTIAALVVVAVRHWFSSDGGGRLSALLMAGTGGVSLLTGYWLAEFGASPGVAFAVGYSMLLGGVAVMARAVHAVLRAIAALGVVATFAAIRATGTGISRSVVTVFDQNINGVGHACGYGLVAAVILLWSARRISVRLVWICASGVSGSGILVTGSRGALLVAVIGLASLAAHRMIVAFPIRAFLTAALGGGLFVVFSAPLQALFLRLSGRIRSSTGENLSDRRSALWYAIDQGMSHPFRGIGMGQVAQVSRMDLDSGLGLNAHNAFASVFAESGVFALAGLLLICGFALVRARAHAPSLLMPLVFAVMASGVSITWWGANGGSALAMVILGTALSCLEPSNRSGTAVPARPATPEGGSPRPASPGPARHDGPGPPGFDPAAPPALVLSVAGARAQGAEPR